MTIPVLPLSIPLSIITVCFRARDDVRATMDNILSQTWKHLEYLVIDGGSADGTLELLEQYESRFLQAGIPFRYLSEPDGGIYDAMNKGVRMAEGQWLLFMNAGDFLADVHTLEQVFSGPPTGQIVYGDTLCIYQGRTKLYPALPLDRITYEMVFCHQSAFVRRELLLEEPYDTAYKVCADHRFFLSMYLQKKAFEHLPFPVSVYEIAGYSDNHKMLSHREKHRMQKELGIFHFSFSWLMRELNFYFKQSVKNIFGQKIIDMVRKSRLR